MRRPSAGATEDVYEGGGECRPLVDVDIAEIVGLCEPDDFGSAETTGSTGMSAEGGGTA